MKRQFLFILTLVAVVALASGACWITLRMADRHPANSQDTHEWIHTNLGLTPEQETQLIPIEQRYEADKRRWNEAIRLANVELGQAILDDEGDSPRVQAAVAKIHQAQGELQQVTLRHVFEMKAVLRPEQYRKLLDLTAGALKEGRHAN